MNKIKRKLLNKTSGIDGIDCRIKLFMIIIVGTTSFWIGQMTISLIYMLLLCIMVRLGKNKDFSKKIFLNYILIFFINDVVRYIKILGLTLIMGVFGITFLNLMPIYLIGKWVIQTTSMDDLMVGFDKMGMHQEVIIPFVVMFRYIPTLRMEKIQIKNAMKLRGISTGIWSYIFHPMKSLEYILIPILMRCFKVSDELAASGMTRGLGRKVKRCSIRVVQLTEKDFVFLFFFITVIGCLIYVDRAFDMDLFIRGCFRDYFSKCQLYL